jgi:acyl-CoA synthetase (AMP-forming)/AMP-acid ligase II
MHLTTLLEMAGDAFGDRVAFGSRDGGLTYRGLLDRARRVGAWAAARGVERVGLVDVNSEVVPTLLFGAGFAGVPYVPMNYRLADEQLAALLTRTAPSVVVVGDEIPGRVRSPEGVELVRRADFLEQLATVDPHDAPSTMEASPEDIAILLFTSGTTGDPKAAVLRHRHLAAYVITTVDFMSADEEEAALVSVPPYHIAGASAVITGVYAGRRVVYLPAFTPESWVATARDEAVTQAMVVPTMLGRVLDLLEREGERLPHLRHLSYGGGRMPIPVLERALALLPHVDFVNAYGLTETSSTIAVLGPDDHRTAIASDDPAVRRRLGSVGRPLPTLDVEIRDVDGQPVAIGEAGEIWVRGEQVAGEYLGRDNVMVDGWFPTKDAGSLDADGFLYLEGRLDDVIVRGAENMSPGEIEDVLARHPSVEDAGVVGVPDTEWGEKVVAAVVVAEGRAASEEDLQEWVKRNLRSSKAPAHIAFREDLPYNETGKLLRRVLKSELSEVFGS